MGIKRQLALLLCLILTAGLAFTTIQPADAAASGQETSTKTAIDKISQVFEAAELFYEELKEAIAEEVESAESEEDTGMSEVEAGIKQLRGYANQLDGLLGELNGLPDKADDSIGRTVLALREYLTILRNMAADMAQLGQYSVELYNAVIIMDGMDEDPDSFSAMAEELLLVTGQSLGMLEKITPPDYLKISHGDVITRMKEFNEFGADFYYAAELNDPLRIYSCMYRMGRIVRLFERYEANLEADMNLQSEQMETRINGSVKLLHDELEHNIGLLKAA